MIVCTSPLSDPGVGFAMAFLLFLLWSYDGITRALESMCTTHIFDLGFVVHQTDGVQCSRVEAINNHPAICCIREQMYIIYLKARGRNPTKSNSAMMCLRYKLQAPGTWRCLGI